MAASRRLQRETDPEARSSAENDLLEATIAVLRVARGEKVARQRLYPERSGDEVLNGLLQENRKLQREIGTLQVTLKNLRLMGEGNGKAKEQAAELEKKLQEKKLETEELMKKLEENKEIQTTISTVEDEFTEYTPEILNTYLKERTILPRFATGDAFYSVSDSRGGVVLEPQGLFSRIGRAIMATTFRSIVDGKEKDASVYEMIKYPEEADVVQDFVRGLNVESEDSSDEEESEENVPQRAEEAWYMRVSAEMENIFKTLATENRTRVGNVQSELSATKAALFKFFDLYKTLQAPQLYKEAYLDALFFVFTKLATGKEVVLAADVAGMENVSWQAKIINKRAGPMYADPDSESVVSAKDELPAMNNSIALVFLEHLKTGELVERPVSTDLLSATYGELFEGDVINVEQFGQKKLLVVPDSIKTEPQLGYALVSSVQKLYERLENVGRPVNVIPLMTKLLFNSALPTDPKVGTDTLFQTFGVRPSYSIQGASKYVASHASMPGAVNHAVDGPGSVVFAVEAGDGKALTRALAQCIAQDNDEPALRGLMEAARTGANGLLPIFASARALLLDSDWEAAVGEAREESTKTLIRAIAEHGREPEALSEFSLRNPFKSKKTLQAALRDVAAKYKNRAAGELASALAENETLAETQQKVTVVIPKDTNLNLAGDGVLSVVVLGKFASAEEILGSKQQFFTLDPSGGNASGPSMQFTPVKSDLLRKKIGYTMRYGENGNTVAVGKTGNVFAGGKKSSLPFSVILLDAASEKVSVRTKGEEEGGAPADVAAMVANVSAAIVSATSDGEAWEAVNTGHEWLNREELLRDAKPSEFLESAQWEEAMRSVREALTEREYDTLDSEAWQHAGALRERL